MTVAQTIIEKKTRLLAYNTAELRVLQNQTYSVEDRSFSMADLGDIQKMIKSLEAEISRLESGGVRVQYIVPTDC